MISALCVALAAQAAPPTYVVQPYYVYPNDFDRRVEHVTAINRVMEELRGWFESRVGAPFTLRRVIEVRSRSDYVGMRVGATATAEDRENKTFMPQWFPSLRDAVGGEFLPRQVSVIFAAGGGGYTTGRISGDDAGVAVVGDWFLQSVSRIADPKAIPAPKSGWQAQDSAQIGILASRMGQAFGLLNPTGYSFPTLVGGFQSYPNTPLAFHERLILRNSPFFGYNPGDNNAPRISHDSENTAIWGESFYVMGTDLRETDMVEWSWMGRPTDNENASTKQVSVFLPILGVSDDRARVTVPKGAGPGFIRVWRGSLRSNMVTVNAYETSPDRDKAGSLTPVTAPR